MSTRLTDLRTAIAANLSQIPNLQVLPYQASQPTAPFAWVFPGGPAGDIEYDLTMRRGLDHWPFTVQVFVAIGSDTGAQVNLDEYMEPAGTRSVKQAVEKADGPNGVEATLGGLGTVHVLSCSGPRQYVLGDAGTSVVLLGAEWHVEVLTLGT
jgi:hypothetical protein